MHYLTTDMSAHLRAKVLTFVLPVVFTGGAVVTLFLALAFHSASEVTTAEVVKVYDHGDGSYSPVLNYRTASGEEIDAAGLWVSSDEYDFPIGTVLAIRADPADPWTVRLDDFQSVWGIPAVIGAIAAPLWIAAFLVWIPVRRRWPRED